MLKIIIISTIIFSKLFSYNDFYEVKQEPTQIKINPKFIYKKGFKLKLIYKFKIEGRVVSSKKYNWDSFAEILTHDIGIVWGKVSKTNIFDQFNWNQKQRFLIYSIREDKLNKIGGAKYVNSHIANIHLIPKDWSIESKLNQIKPYDIIEIEGYLTDVYSKRRMILTSISRTDSGPGACEVIYVTNIKFKHKRKDNYFYTKHKNKIIDTHNMDFKTPGKGTRASDYFR